MAIRQEAIGIFATVLFLGGIFQLNKPQLLVLTVNMHKNSNPKFSTRNSNDEINKLKE